MFVGMKETTILYDCLRYSLVPSEKMLLSSINRYSDSKRKCLDEYGNNGSIRENSYSWSSKI